ncbi:MAG: hypothetical protein CXT73_02020 [Methanobacteriota archaeon]|jgi:hypothetical protein|nr:MAG: hypothetical protein CXT73_02020 [Euryarchaeota archaeon]
MTDIDIDLKNREDVLSKLQHISASIITNTVKKHNTGVYFHNIPHDPSTNLSTISYKEAEDLGYFKIDLLNVNIYEHVKNEAHLNTLLKRVPDWDLLVHKEIVQQLFHIHDHYDIVAQMQPRSIDQLAMVLAIIRPAKRNLLGQQWLTIEKQVWLKPNDNSYYFKKSHAISYAYAIIVQLNSLCELVESVDA